MANGQADPDKLSQLFIEATDDLSYARAFYPNRSVKVYLNFIAQRVFLSLYKQQRGGFGRKFVAFWRDELPQLVYESRRELLFSFATFVVGMLIGMVSTDIYPEFLRVVVGDEYVDQTLENIKNGDPMAIYKDPDATGMFIRIALNNLRVSLLIFIAGCLASMGSVALILMNAILIGSFQYFFYKQGQFEEMFFTVWVHGTLEMSCMVIAGAAGILLGKGLVFPGTLTRIQAFILTGRRGVALLAGIAPLVVLAAIVESFFTRFTDMSIWVRGGFILGSLAFVLGYFRFYAWQRADRSRVANLHEADLPPSPKFHLEFDRIKSSGEIFADIIVFFRKHLSAILSSGLVVAVLATGAMASLAWYQNANVFQFDPPRWVRFSGLEIFYILFMAPISNAFQVLAPDRLLSLHALVSWLFCTGLSVVVMAKLCAESGRSLWGNRTKAAIGVLTAGLYNAAFVGFLWLGPTPVLLLFSVVMPLLYLSLFVALQEQRGPFSAFVRAVRLSWAAPGRLLVPFWIVSFMANVVLLLVTAPFSQMYVEWLAWNLPLTLKQAVFAKQTVLTFLYFVGVSVTFPLLLLSSGFTYFGLREIREATSLFPKIKKVGQSRRVYGLEQESD